MTTALYAGTFDPCTQGHLWVINEAASLFDTVIVGLAHNPDKHPYFSLEDRKRFLKFSISHPNVYVEEIENQFAIQFAHLQGAKYLIRGLRSPSDFELEQKMVRINQTIQKDITTIFLMPPVELGEIASSTVKGLVGIRNWEPVVKPMIPLEVMRGFVFKEYFKVPMREKFQTLWNSLGITKDGTSLFCLLRSKYTHPSRHYHTFDHINVMLTWLESVRDLIKNWPALAAAIWFHDFEYSIDTPPGVNEQESKEKALQYLLDLCPRPSMLKGMGEAILITTHDSHKIDDPDLQIMADLDILSLGSDYKSFLETSKLVEKEYDCYPYPIFESGRKEFLQKHFLDRPHIFMSPFFRDRFEVQARSNIKRYIRS